MHIALVWEIRKTSAVPFPKCVFNFHTFRLRELRRRRWHQNQYLGKFLAACFPQVFFLSSTALSYQQTAAPPENRTPPSGAPHFVARPHVRAFVPKNNFLLARRSGKVRKDRKGGDWGGERSIRGATWAHLLLSTAEIWHFNFISCLYMQHTPKPNKCADDDGHGDDDNLHTRQWDQMDF